MPRNMAHGHVNETLADRDYEADMLTRLERQAVESGRLLGRVEALEQALKAERDARRRITDRLKRERVAAESLHRRAESAEAALGSAQEEIERLRESLEGSEQRIRTMWAQLHHAELEEWVGRPRWRRLFRRPPS